MCPSISYNLSVVNPYFFNISSITPMSFLSCFVVTLALASVSDKLNRSTLFDVFHVLVQPIMLTTLTTKEFVASAIIIAIALSIITHI